MKCWLVNLTQTLRLNLSLLAFKTYNLFVLTTYDISPRDKNSWKVVKRLEGVNNLVYIETYCRWEFFVPCSSSTACRFPDDVLHEASICFSSLPLAEWEGLLGMPTSTKVSEPKGKKCPNDATFNVQKKHNSTTIAGITWPISLHLLLG